jgi:D-lactate dehydrogenase
MRVLMTSARSYDRASFASQLGERQSSPHTFTYSSARLEASTAGIVAGHEAVCAFVNDDLSALTLERIAAQGVRFLALRCAGSNQVDIEAASRWGVSVARVPAYGADSVAEFTLALLFGLARRVHRSHSRIRENNFDLSGLVGIQLRGRSVGVVGPGLIGAATARLLLGLGMKVLASDPVGQVPDLVAAGVTYLELPELLQQSEVVSLHCPLLPSTHHLINEESLALMKAGALLINSSRGGLIDTPAVIRALRSRHLGGLAIDVYEGEKALFFADHSEDIIGDDLFHQLKSFPNVLITGHQAFLTHEALAAIAATTLDNLDAMEAGLACPNLVLPRP